MKKNVKINDIADYMILMCHENGIEINPLKLQKLLYYIQAWHLVYFNKERLFCEMPQAWVNGPVYPTIYRRFCHIPRYQPITLKNAGIQDSLSDKARVLGLSSDQYEFIDSIFQFYGVMDHDRLVFLTHAEEPWSEKRVGKLPYESSTEELSEETMYNYYHHRMERNRARRK